MQGRADRGFVVDRSGGATLPEAPSVVAAARASRSRDWSSQPSPRSGGGVENKEASVAGLVGAEFSPQPVNSRTGVPPWPSGPPHSALDSHVELRIKLFLNQLNFGCLDP